MSTANDSAEFDDSDDELDWEEVEVPDAPQHIEITLNSVTKERGVKGKEVKKPTAQRKGLSPAERLKRINCHKIHTISLIANAWMRNRWINDELLQARLLSLTPLALQNSFALIHKSRVPEAARRGRLFQAAMTRLVEWWSGEFFDIASTGHLRNKTYDAVQEGLAGEGFLTPKPIPDSVEGSEDDISLAILLEALKDLKPIDQESLQAAINDDGEFIRSPKSLMRHALMQSGSRDTSAQLFTSLCRSLGIPARLVVSIQSVPWQSSIGPTKPKPKEKAKDNSKSVPKATSKASSRHASSSKATRSDASTSQSNPQPTSSSKKTRSKTKTPSKSVVATGKGKGKAVEPEDIDDTTSDDDSSFMESGTNTSSEYSPSAQFTTSPRSRKRPLKATTSKSTGKPPSSPHKADASSLVTSTPPIFWTEVYSKGDGRWLPVDPVRCIVNKRKVFDPTQLPSISAVPSIYRSAGISAPQKKLGAKGAIFSPKTTENRMVYVLAFEEDGYARDVTRRYAREYAVKVAKMQGQGRGKGRLQWWEGVLGMIHRPYRLRRDDVEDEELEAVQMSEGMPTTVAGFKDHPLYVLTRHLHVNQVIYPEPPETPELGKFRGEPVYPRSSVIDLKTSENWLRSEGRVVKAGCQPLKSVKARVSTVNKMRAIEALKEAGSAASGPAMQGLYARSQTETFVPPPIVDGVVPKNNYGNIDLYVPSMLPAVKGVWKTARKLGFDYAEAVTGFHFKSRRAMPVIDGIVIAAENEAVLLEAYAEAEQEYEKKARAQREERVIKRWKRLIQGLQIRKRLQAQYQDTPLEIKVQAAQDEISAEQDTVTDQGGGFLVEPDDVVQPFHLPRNTHPVLPSYPSHLLAEAPRVKTHDVPEDEDEVTAEPLVLGTMDLDSDVEGDWPPSLDIPKFVPKTMKELAEKHNKGTTEMNHLPDSPLSTSLDEGKQLESEDLPEAMQAPRAKRKAKPSTPEATRSSTRPLNVGPGNENDDGPDTSNPQAVPTPRSPAGITSNTHDGDTIFAPPPGLSRSASQAPGLASRESDIDDGAAIATVSPKAVRTSSRLSARRQNADGDAADNPNSITRSASRSYNTKRRLSDAGVEVVITESPPTKKRKAKATKIVATPVPGRVLRPRASKSQSQLRP